MESLQAYIEGCGCEALEGFFNANPRFGELPVDQLSGKYNEFTERLKDYARELSSAQRFDLYMQVHFLTVELKDCDYLNSAYTLNDSFISTPEAELEMLKYLHEPHTQSEISEHFDCNSNTVQKWQNDFKDGFRFGDMGIQLEFERGGKLRSTVHPIMLPLNLTEVYSLLKVLKDSGSRKSDPHGFVASEIADKIYNQLSDYAKAKVDKLIVQEGFDFDESNMPVFANEEPGYAKEFTRAYYEKSSRLVEVELEDGTVLRGRIAPAMSSREAFVLMTGRGSENPELRWDEVVIRIPEKRPNNRGNIR